jgi:hypothetical protein
MKAYVSNYLTTSVTIKAPSGEKVIIDKFPKGIAGFAWVYDNEEEAKKDGKYTVVNIKDTKTKTINFKKSEQ